MKIYHKPQIAGVNYICNLQNHKNQIYTHKTFQTYQLIVYNKHITNTFSYCYYYLLIFDNVNFSLVYRIEVMLYSNKSMMRRLLKVGLMMQSLPPACI